jgi:hypothetical protein
MQQGSSQLDDPKGEAARTSLTTRRMGMRSPMAASPVSAALTLRKKAWACHVMVGSWVGVFGGGGRGGIGIWGRDVNKTESRSTR